MVLHCDLLTPTLPILFPNAREQDLFSVGTVLAKPNIFRGDIVSNLVTVKERQNLGFLGYRTGENRYSFPTFGRGKVAEFFAVLSDLADSIVVDCTSDPESNLLTAVSLQDAGTLIRVSSPDLSSLSFFQSQTGAGFGTPKERTVSILNVRASCQGGTGNRVVNHHDFVCPERQHHRRGGREHRLSQTAREGYF